MKKLFIVLYLIFLPILVFSNGNATKKKIGVSKFSYKNVSEQDAMTVTDIFRSKLVETEAYSVLSRDNMEIMLNEIKFQKTGLTEVSNAVKIGKILNIEYMVYGTLSKLEKNYLISFEMVNIETSKIERSKSQKFTSMDDVDVVINNLVKYIVSGEKIEPYIESKPTTPDGIKKALIKKYCPSGNKYKKYEILGYITSYDDIIEKNYAFLLYKETKMPSGDSIIKLAANLTINNIFKKEWLVDAAKKAHSENKEYEKISSPLKPSKGDNRLVEYRVYHKNGKPLSLEIFVITRDADWQAKEPVTINYSLESLE